MGVALAALLALALGTAGNAGAVTRAHPAAATLSAHGSVEQVYVTGLRAGERMSLLNRRGRTVATQRADSLGGLLFRNVPPGGGYRVRRFPRRAESAPVTVLSTRPAPPSTGVYNQTIPSTGYSYLTTRDGTQLAIDVHPPQQPAGESVPPLPSGITPPSQLQIGPIGVTLPSSVATGPPWPTLIEYSGYGYADPAGPQNGIAILANLMGFAVVDVNMRGTGCSGGAFDFFEPLQSLDGYDVIETIARQPWVLGHRVGMMGISYGGISQLFTAQTDPPSLAAISPLSVIDNTQTTLYPGGILNTGFAVAWAQERIHDAEPASPNGGQAWAYQRIQQGDQTCRANQVLHGEAVNLLDKIRANSHYNPSVADPLSPITFVNRIKVPVYMACQWTDEQTGGHCPDLSEHFTGTRQKWFTLTNGTHVDSLDPETFNRWYDFLELFVAHQAPIIGSAAIHAAAPVIYQSAMGISGVTLPPDPIQLQPTYDSALAAFERLQQIRVLFDNGAGNGGNTPGYPYPGFEASFDRFPIPGTSARSWYLAPGGALAARPPARAGANRFTWDAHAVPLTDFTGPQDGNSGGIWTAMPPYNWAQNPSGTAVSYLTSPLTANATVIGAGAVHLWVRSSTPSVDLQATITEVRPDGHETFVQNGWVRANERKLDARRSTLLEPVLSLRQTDVSPMPRDRFVPVTIPLYYEGHAYRAGSRIRLVLSAPNGTQPIWSFGQTNPAGHATVAVAFSRGMPSRLILPLVPGVSVLTGLPPCPGLRGEPCRTYESMADRTATP
ncbi:MAG TPA: CocE/NonD family hydrolase [Solirubrobacteraceae bacterium]|nr:CocE/NonD family hydrolase [Solirubrobacteraceae bacterium]